jgi:hypothetical protein
VEHFADRFASNYPAARIHFRDILLIVYIFIGWPYKQYGFRVRAKRGNSRTHCKLLGSRWPEISNSMHHDPPNRSEDDQKWVFPLSF